MVDYERTIESPKNGVCVESVNSLCLTSVAVWMERKSG